MEELRSEIIRLLRRNRISTTEVADCLGKTGVLENVYPVNRGMYAAGAIQYVYAYKESNWPIHDQIRNVKPDQIILMDAIDVKGRALAGELVTKYLCLYNQICAIICLGKMRDANDLIKNRYPVWCTGFNPVGCFNCEVKETAEINSAAQKGKELYDGAIAVCDDTGVIVIPKSCITEKFYKKLEQIEQQEDIWFNCIDFRKWNTFDTVCLKKYKNETGI